MSMAAISLAAAFLLQSWAVFATILGRLQNLAVSRHHPSATTLVTFAPGTPIAHLAVQH